MNIENLKTRIAKNPQAFYRLTKIKKQFGYINMGVNYFMYSSINSKGNGVQITVFKQPLHDFEVTIKNINKFIVT